MMNEIVKEQKMKFSVAIQSDGIQRLINSSITDQNTRQRFVTSMMSMVGNNEKLQECTPVSIVTGSLLAESLKLPTSPSLGYCYLIPYNNIATFVVGYKGYLQLAIRTGQYKNIFVEPIKKGEMVSFDRLTGQSVVNFIENDIERELAETVGYLVGLEYLNGFKKSIYWTMDKMKSHALRYSKAYNYDLKHGKSNSFWTTDFDGMGCKTMIRQLLTKWGIMSIELQTAFENDDERPETDIVSNLIEVSNIQKNHSTKNITQAETVDEKPIEEKVEQVEQVEIIDGFEIDEDFV